MKLFFSFVAAVSAEQFHGHNGHKNQVADHHQHPAHGKSSSISKHKAQPHAANRIQRLRSYDDAQKIHICLFSDRLDAMPPSMRSITQNTRNPENLHFWIITDHKAVNEMNQYEQPLHQGGGEEAGAAPRAGKSRLSMRMSLGRMSGRMSLGGLSGLSNLTSGETTFGRAMSGLSALSIDWENMEDFDINVDHSEGINNDIVNAQQQQQQQQQNGEPSYDYEAAGPDTGSGPRVARRSSLRKNIPVNPSANMNVSFNM